MHLTYLDITNDDYYINAISDRDTLSTWTILSSLNEIITREFTSDKCLVFFLVPV